MRLLFSRDPISRNLRRVLFAAGAIGFFQATASATAVSTITFNDGEYLNVVGAYGPAAGPGINTAYVVIDLNTGTPASASTAWQVNWNSNTTLNGWQMITNIASTANIAASFNDPTNITTTTNPSGDPNLTVNATADDFGDGPEHFVDNFVYSGTTGVQDFWEFETGSYDPANVSASNPQGMTWVPPGEDGLDLTNITDGEFIGMIDDFPATDPPLPEANLPEPSQALLGTMVISCLLLIRPRRAKA